MAEHAHTTPALTPHVTEATLLRSRRRTLFAAASAVIMGGGITAGAAASVADLVPTNPDAKLIELCERFNAIERRHYVEFAAWSAAGDEDQADAVMERMSEEHQPLLDRIVEMPPTTLAGATALATTLYQWCHGDFCRGQTTDSLLARTLICGLGAAVAGRA